MSAKSNVFLRHTLSLSLIEDNIDPMLFKNPEILDEVKVLTNIKIDNTLHGFNKIFSCDTQFR